MYDPLTELGYDSYLLQISYLPMWGSFVTKRKPREKSISHLFIQSVIEQAWYECLLWSEIVPDKAGNKQQNCLHRAYILPLAQ